ncbi:gliding motility lipoprotein GldH [Aequorivita aquimaris]|uniref:Gliding motility protein GldH n=3 Tax=Aequorivita TaxID=153265 RepID=A0A137RK21_9FLAO|nr:gliding motility lipoprotein GldH [Aequorivita aquimaris]KJJ39637.1 gliding motility protein GldH [Aequorivita vladivostokensis]MAO48937.1 gliding motility lipoprotein GldH [Aequorivita sp.]KXO00529.1 gliding motility protein GldH [Aequorivita aquimaris]MBF32046.1 gliding motility lipoprotein GldH [Aequorivita sp.]HAV53391.1 gliding motility lipoprotein GldH [Aequorivita sp.]|tara:strand:+ start:103510 stop:103995 length:486 start_codon:yes stop_codon:yes gene_type:complete
MNRLMALFLTVVMLVSCESNTVFSESQAMDGHWGADEVVQFKLPQLDSLKKYNLFLNIRNTNEYRYNNLFLIVNMTFPHGKTVTDTLEYRMAQPDGSWMGQGIGNIKENKLWYKENVQFFEDGIYTVDIAQAMRNNGDVEGVTKLEGITDVGFSIEEASKQ